MPEGVKPTGDRLTDTMIRRVGEVEDELYDDVWLSPAERVGSAGVAQLVADKCISVNFPDAASSRALWMIPVKDEWLNHNVRVTVYYTSTTVDTNNFAITVTAWAFGGTNNVSTGGTQLDSIAVTPAGPGTAYVLSSFTATLDTNAVTAASHAFMNLVLIRDGVGDANNAAFNVVAVKCEFNRI